MQRTLGFENNKFPRGFVVFLVCVKCFMLFGFWTVFRSSILPHHHPAGYDQLVSAIYANDSRKVEALLKSGVNPNAFPSEMIDLEAEDDIAPLDSAARAGNVEIVTLLLDHGADPNMGDGYNGSPLEGATWSENFDLMELMIKRGAKVNDSAEGSNALWRAAIDGKVKTVKFLLDHGAKPESNSNWDLLKALRDNEGSQEVIAILEERIRTAPKK